MRIQCIIWWIICPEIDIMEKKVIHEKLSKESKLAEQKTAGSPKRIEGDAELKWRIVKDEKSKYFSGSGF